MIDSIYIDNALFIYETLLKRLNDPEGKLKGVWYLGAKQQDFLLKMMLNDQGLTSTQSRKLWALSGRLSDWEKSGGVRVDEEGRLY